MKHAEEAVEGGATHVAPALPHASAAVTVADSRFTPATLLRLQRSIGNTAVTKLVTDHSPKRVLARHPAGKVLKFAAKWLSKRGAKQVSKHIAKHGRNIAGKALHSIFKQPNNINWLLKRTIAEAGEVAERHASKAAGEVLEEGAIRIERQAMGPGKWRLKVQKTFKEAIGTKGETVLRVIIDQSGRIVTAFPADRLAVAGLTGAGLLALEEGTADAAENLRADADAQARTAMEKEDSWGDWQEWIPFIGDIWGGSLNEGEDEYLRQQRFYEHVVEDVITRIEHEEQRSIDGSERIRLRELIRAGIAAPMMTDEDEEG